MVACLCGTGTLCACMHDGCVVWAVCADDRNNTMQCSSVREVGYYVALEHLNLETREHGRCGARLEGCQGGMPM